MEQPPLRCPDRIANSLVLHNSPCSASIWRTGSNH